MRAGLRLHHRIVIPFVLVALVATSAASYAALWAVSRALEGRVRGQLLSASGVVARGDFAVNRAILLSVREITGAHVLTFTTAGVVLASTVEAGERGDLVARVTAAGVARGHEATPGAASVVRMDCGVPCFVAFRPVEGRPGTVVALVADSSELVALTSAVTRTVLLAAALSVVVMMLASQVVARRVTAPLARLSDFAHGLTVDAPYRRAPTGEDEIGQLAGAFNGMLDRVDQSREALLRSGKLALAGLLAARVAHDVRNPLSSIQMQAQLLRAETREPDQRATLDAILHDIDQVESVVSDLLELARPGAPRLQPAQVNTVVREALQQMSAQLRYRKIAVEDDLEEALPTVNLDAHRFKQALLNVLRNAADAIHAGGTIAVRTRRVDMAVVIEVRDDGVGVDPAMVEQVFEPFVSTKPDGVGLGLVNTRAVVESHGGTIVLERQHPAGTCVRMSIPIDTVITNDSVPTAHDG